MTLADELLPCPFCGAAATAMTEGINGPYRVYCNNDGTPGDDGPPPCSTEGPERATKPEAIAAWNTRAVIPMIRAQERAEIVSLIERCAERAGSKECPPDWPENVWRHRQAGIENALYGLRSAIDRLEHKESRT